MTATCDYCKRSMDGTSCDPLALAFTLDDETELVGRAPFGTFLTLDVPPNCHDCATPLWGFHHSGCVLDVCVHAAQVGVGGCPEGCKVVA